MRVLIAESGSGYGGTGKYLYELLKSLKSETLEVRVLTYGSGPFMDRIEREILRPEYRPAWRYCSERGVFVELLRTLKRLPSLIRWLRQTDVRIVHLNNEILTHIPLILAARICSMRVIVHFHGWRPLTRLERCFLPMIDEYLCISEPGAEYFSQQLNGPVVRAVVNGISTENERRPDAASVRAFRAGLGVGDDEILVSLVGRLVRWKGQDIFLRALARVVELNPKVRGLIVGHDSSEDRAYRKYLADLSRSLGLSASVIFQDWQDDMNLVYGATDIVVHASTEPEPFGLVLVEAMAAGKPVIGTRAGGASGIIEPGRTGEYVDPGDVRGLAEKIVALADNAALRSQYGDNGRKVVRVRYTIHRNAAEIEGIYAALGRKTGARAAKVPA